MKAKAEPLVWIELPLTVGRRCGYCGRQFKQGYLVTNKRRTTGRFCCPNCRSYQEAKRAQS